MRPHFKKKKDVFRGRRKQLVRRTGEEVDNMNLKLFVVFAILGTGEFVHSIL